MSNIIELHSNSGAPRGSLQKENERLAAENRYLLGRIQQYADYSRSLEAKIYT